MYDNLYIYMALITIFGAIKKNRTHLLRVFLLERIPWFAKPPGRINRECSVNQWQMSYHKLH